MAGIEDVVGMRGRNHIRVSERVRERQRKREREGDKTRQDKFFISEGSE